MIGDSVHPFFDERLYSVNSIPSDTLVEEHIVVIMVIPKVRVKNGDIGAGPRKGRARWVS